MYLFFVLVVFLFHLGLGFYIFEHGSSRLVNRFYAYAVFSLSIWGLGSLIMSQSDSLVFAFAGSRIAAFGYIFFPAFYFYFVAVFSRKERLLHQWPLFLTIFGVAFAFLYLTWTSDAIISGVQVRDGYFISDLGKFFYLLIVYYAVLASGMAIMFGSYLRKSVFFKREKRQAYLVLLATVVPTLLLVLTDFPTLFPETVGLRMGFIITGLNVLMMTYALLRYQVVRIEDMLHTRHIFSLIDDAVIVADHRLSLVLANEAFFRMTSFSPKEAIGRILPEFLKGEKNLGSLLTGKSVAEDELYFLTKKSKKIPIHIKSSIILDSEGESIGLVIVARDLRDSSFMNDLQSVKKKLEHRLKALRLFEKTDMQKDL